MITSHRAWWRVARLLALAALVATGTISVAAPVSAAGEQIVVTADPPLDQIRPHGGPSAGLEPDKLIIEVKDASGRNLTNVKLDVRLETPGTNPLLSTDVPRIEGITVLNWSGVSPDGRQEFSYAFPIRGTYHLTVTASPAPGSTTFSAVSKDMTFTIQEKGKSFVYLALLLAALFAFGAVSGIVLGRANMAGRGR